MNSFKTINMDVDKIYNPIKINPKKRKEAMKNDTLETNSIKQKNICA